MKHQSHTFFELFSLIWISVAIVGLLLALLGIFYPGLVILSLVGVGGSMAYQIKKRTIVVTAFSRAEWTVTLLSIAVAAILSAYTTPTIFGGRDEGSYTNAAIMLAKDHQLFHTSEPIKQFFTIYGPGKALNFPGFAYTTEGALKSQFLPGYISWLAVMYSLFGLAGISVANFLPFITFLVSFYLICRKLLDKCSLYLAQHTNFEEAKINNFSLFAFLLFLTSFPLLFFYKFGLSEIFFGALLWFAFYLILEYFEKKSFNRYLLIFLPFALMVFTRIEAIGFFAILFLLLVLKDFSHIRQAKYQFVYALLGIVVVASLIFNSNFFIDTAKNIMEPFIGERSNAASSVVSDDLQDLYLVKIFHTYNLLPLVLMSGIYVIYLARQKRFPLLIPVFFFLPALVYLIDANISLDHPWMLRRFLFAIIPLFIIYSMLFLFDLYHRGRILKKLKPLAYGIILLMLAINATLWFSQGPNVVNIITYSQNTKLFGNTQQLAGRFGPRDLVLVSQRSTGSGWSLMAEPMRNILGLQAAYFFNPYDYAKINTNAFDSVYLITSRDEASLYDVLPKEQAAAYSLSNSVIDPLRNPLEKFQVKEYTIDGIIYKLEK